MTIRIRQMRKTYRVGVERIHALRGVDLDIEKNEFVAIMGASGSGKSTLMNILGCLDRPSAGEYHLAGRRTDRMSGAELAQVRNELIGFVFQSFELLPRQTAQKNVELPLVYARGGWLNRRKRAREALDRVGLGERVRHRPNQLSGGQKQRVAIARTLLKDPRILILDDSTSSVDTETEAEIRQAMNNLMKNRTTFIIAHRIQSIMAADLILVLDKGAVVQSGTHEQLLQQDGIYRQIFEIQTRIEVELKEEISSAG